jgi:hypothetical protein
VGLYPHDVEEASSDFRAVTVVLDAITNVCFYMGGSGVWLGTCPVVPSRFETLVETLGLADRPEEWGKSAELRQWAREHRNYYFVPERLLSEWRLSVREDGLKVSPG